MDFFNKDQFKKLTPEEKSKVLQDLVLHPEEILCKSMNDLFTVMPKGIKPNNRLFIQMTQANINLHNGDEIICQFLYKGESLYIFRCEYQDDVSSPCLIVNGDFYMIQRRENFRLKFPGSFYTKVIIKNKNSILIGKVFDLSTSGIRVAAPKDAENLPVGDAVEMEIQVVGHAPITINAHLRHRTEGTESVNEKKVPYFYFGFQFLNISSENEKSLSRINMELYRNFFQKVSG